MSETGKGGEAAVNTNIPFYDTKLSFEERARDIVSRLTMEEKAAQMLHEAPAIPRFGIPEYNWWNECLHGVARAGVATVFPQAIGLAAIWSSQRMTQIARVIADEGRAKHHEFARQNDRGYYKGLTFWTPNINIFRDPRWGRGHETYGECPHLTARLGVAFCKELQGDDPKYLKLVATPKHFAVHSGPEGLRHSFDARATPKDLRETYLPAFRDCIVEAKAYSIMSAYNRTNGEPCSSSKALLVDILREEWKFDGYVVSDCWAIRDIHEHHKVTSTPEESARDAVRAGCDLNCGCTYEHIPSAVKQGLLNESDLDACVTRLFLARLKLGMFDPPEQVPYASIPYELNDCPEHADLARLAARESMVLLKNQGSLLPLSKDLGSIAVIGPNANDPHVLVGNYFGVPSEPITPLQGIRERVAPGTKVWYTEGCKRQGSKREGLGRAGLISEAVSMAQRADVVVLCLGLSADIEGEQGDAGNSEAAGDKTNLELPGLQQALLEEIVAVGKPTVLVLISGSALSVTWADDNVRAILQAWYPGQAGGRALADVLFGDYCPAGRLPITFPRSLEDVPEFTDYSMKGRTYRYLEREPLYPFGYGLSYTRFAYSNIQVSKSRVELQDTVEISADVENVGECSGDEVVQLYLKCLDAPFVVPHHQLRGFERIPLAPGERRRMVFLLTARDLSQIDDRGARVFQPGRYRVSVGGSQPDERSGDLIGEDPLSIEFELVGDRRELPY
ncbi:MAG TPA: glycoside hydrolase family 3 C-terminal domain-containing protein [Polyangiaceae bacterium]|nr:glycoside hydrolase family 3 C-terminal domain-containing protein [Polyangiaceae bacterium]